MDPFSSLVDARTPSGPVGAEAIAFLLGFNGTSWDRLRTAADNGDALAVATLGLLRTFAEQAAFNGASWDRLRNNVELTLFSSAVRSADVNSPDQTNYNHRGAIVVVDMTVVPGVDTVTPKIQGKDPVSGKYYDVLAGAAIVAVSTVILRVYPGITVAANLAVSDLLPRTWRVFMDHSAASSFTYSVGGILLL